MHIAAHVTHDDRSHVATVSTDDATRSLDVPPKPDGRGSAVNGGEFLMLALATCYCNDLYREAARQGLTLTRVEVQASAHFDGPGLAARDIRYRARVESPATREQVAALLRHTDAVAEVHNTVRTGVPVVLVEDDA